MITVAAAPTAVVSRIIPVAMQVLFSWVTEVHEREGGGGQLNPQPVPRISARNDTPVGGLSTCYDRNFRITTKPGAEYQASSLVQWRFERPYGDLQIKVASELANMIAREALSKPYRQIKPLPTEKFRNWMGTGTSNSYGGRPFIWCGRSVRHAPLHCGRPS